MVCVRLKLRVSKQGGENLRIKFGIDNHIAQDTVKVTTHSSCEKTWGRIKEAILTTEQTIVVIDAKTNKKVSRLLSDVSSIESKEQMCHVVFTSNERYLLAVRLKIVEKQFTDLCGSTLVRWLIDLLLKLFVLRIMHGLKLK